jgi:hypothetical protein
MFSGVSYLLIATGKHGIFSISVDKNLKSRAGVSVPQINSVFLGSTVPLARLHLPRFKK